MRSEESERACLQQERAGAWGHAPLYSWLPVAAPEFSPGHLPRDLLGSVGPSPLPLLPDREQEG